MSCYVNGNSMNEQQCDPGTRVEIEYCIADNNLQEIDCNDIPMWVVISSE